MNDYKPANEPFVKSNTTSLPPLLNKTSTSKANRHFWSVVALWAVLLLTSIFMMGCLHEKDEAAVIENTPIITVAPTASFSQSLSAGKAPLILTFTDSSTAGTANISQWLWDFGDGGTSTEQNPQYSYLQAGTFNVTLTVTSNDGSDNYTKNSAVAVIPADVQITMTVVGKKGLPLDGIIASSTIFQIEEQVTNNNTQLVVSIRPTELQGIVRLKKEGYADALVFIDGAQFGDIKSIALLKLDPAIVFNGSFGGEFFGRDGASVKLPEAALLKPDGSAVQGPVQLYITPIDVSDFIEGQAFPGSFFGLPDENDIPDGAPLQHQIISYGVTQFTFYQEGEELQLREGQLADIELPLYRQKNLYGDNIQIGESIPLWVLDESSGIWQQEGVGTVVSNPAAKSGLSMKAQTPHFSTFNSDAWGGFGGGTGGGSGGGQGWCPFTADFIGAEEGKPIQITLSLLLVNSSMRRVINDRTISGFVPRGLRVKLSATQKDSKYGETLFDCDQSNERVNVIVSFGDSPPEFREWSMVAKPVFTKEPATGDYEILTNTINVGGRFVGTDFVEIATPLLNAEITTLPNYQFIELVFDQNTDTNPTVITATLTNDEGSTVRQDAVSFIDSHSPIVNMLYANESDTLITFNWSVVGADEGAVYYLGEDPSALGTLVFRINDVDKGSIDNNQLLGLTGFIRVEFSNQYGSSVAIARLKELDCIPGSESAYCGY